MKKGIAQTLAWTLAATSSIGMLTPLKAYANSSTNMDLRKRVVGVAGIMTITGDMTQYITRAEFARMLVRASAYRNVLTSSSNVSVFADVASGNEYASAIRIAAENGWMTGYLGGTFKPDQYITLNEAAKGLLYLLGYTAQDFDGDQYNKRMAMYSSLDLSENMEGLKATDTLTKLDCVNLFYNLLKCDKANSNTAYVTVLDGELSSDGEVNPLTLADKSLKGPKLVSSPSELNSAIPFDTDDSNYFLNGQAATRSLIKQACEGSGYVILYYSVSAKTVWAYNGDADDSEGMANGMGVVKGEITNIYYESSSTLTPSAVTLDDGNKYYLTSSDMQFAFSIYGSLRVGDNVALIYEISTDSNGDTKYTVTDYVDY